ncbi:Superoxide dismutase [Mn] [Poriferisphaera corsica]|uniref:Superoxide dismutase n=1 Tax=Poriferisphaera corsica TaxID=2528020 RepID=A0A517YQ84_9BACT|nr:superoxide dismutase [Poriferisphaera corsica]QDU32385.1 Superoxide dismutase [Mn] [Poriferisphaera corsica]
MAFELPELPYALNALEPAIDAKTMEIHHGKHHAAYVANLNAALEGITAPECICELISNLDNIPDAKRTAVINNGGGHANHSLFWTILAPKGQGGEPSAELKAAIDKSFGSMDAFKELFAKAAATRFGSGWAWLCGCSSGLCICSTPNQNNPRMGEYANATWLSECGCKDGDCRCVPILGLDVWEHAYYLNYQNRRPDYIKSFFDVVNWNEVSRRFAEAK